MRQTIIGCFFLNIFTLCITSFMFAQNSKLEGYILEEGNNVYLNAVSIKITEKATNKFITNTTTNERGFFSTMLPAGNTYLFQANKHLFLPQQTIISVKPLDKKLFVTIKMFRNSGVLVDKSPQLSSPEIVKAVSEYGIDTKKITANVNPDGVALANLVNENDAYSEITNATRLVDENYVDATDEELMKLQPMLTNFQSPVKVDPSAQKSGPKVNEDLPNPYDQKVVDKMIIPEPKYGETIVAVAQNNPRTRILPNSYTGYKIEFFTSLSALPATHKIFTQHGNIVLERKSNGLYSYLLGDFKDKKIAATFLQESLLNRYPTATLIAYENGQRKLTKKITKAKTKPVFAPPR